MASKNTAPNKNIAPNKNLGNFKAPYKDNPKDSPAKEAAERKKGIKT